MYNSLKRRETDRVTIKQGKKGITRKCDTNLHL